MKIAIVGNIASGKSEVERILINLGYNVYDTDKIAHSILEKSSEVKEIFGTVDRKELASIVFNDKDKLKTLESIIHPLVKKELLNISDDLAFISIPQLFESGMESLFDKIIFVSAPIETRLDRLIKRNNLTREDALKRINAQMSEEEKILRSDYVIKNTSTINELEKAVKELLDLI